MSIISSESLATRNKHDIKWHLKWHPGGPLFNIYGQYCFIISEISSWSTLSGLGYILVSKPGKDLQLYTWWPSRVYHLRKKVLSPSYSWQVLRNRIARSKSSSVKGFIHGFMYSTNMHWALLMHQALRALKLGGALLCWPGRHSPHLLTVDALPTWAGYMTIVIYSQWLKDLNVISKYINVQRKNYR